MLLSNCKQGDVVIIDKLLAGGPLKQRLMDLGFIRNARLTLVRYAPLKDPIQVKLKSSNLSLRVEEATRIEVSFVEKEP